MHLCYADESASLGKHLDATTSSAFSAESIILDIPLK